MENCASKETAINLVRNGILISTEENFLEGCKEVMGPWDRSSSLGTHAWGLSEKGEAPFPNQHPPH